MSAVPVPLLVGLGLAEAILLAASIILLLGHAAHARVRARRDDERLAVLHAALSRQLADGPSRRSATAVRALPFRLQVRLLDELAPNLTGAHRAHLVSLMTRVGMTERAERLCASRRWWRRLRGLRLLTVLQAGAGVAPALLNDPRPEVRAQAIDWVAENPDPVLIDRLLDLLGQDAPGGLLPVTDALVRIGQPCLESLTRFLTERRGSALREGLAVAVVLADARMLRPALVATTDADPRIRALAATLVAGLGGADAADRLVELLDDCAPEVRAMAVRGLGRLEYWPAAAQVARSLRDPAWAVRSEAALTLRTLGTTGMLLLQRALGDNDAFARDAARQVLDLPGARPELAA